MGLMAWMILECLSEELVRYVGLSSLTVEMIADIEVKKKKLKFSPCCSEETEISKKDEASVNNIVFDSRLYFHFDSFVYFTSNLRISPLKISFASGSLGN